MDEDVLYSVNEYPTDGIQATFEVSFAGGYISKEHVVVRYFDSSNVISEPAFSWVGDFEITFVAPPAAGGRLRIYRVTPAGLPLVDFSDGSVVNEATLDLNAKQAVFLAAEVRDVVSTAPGLDDILTAGAVAEAARDDALAAQAAAEAAAAQAAVEVDDFKDELADVGGGSLIGYKRTGATGTLIRTAADRIQRDTIPILDFCSGNLAEDATTGVRNFLAALKQYNAQGDIPPGDYRLTDTVEILFDQSWQGRNLKGRGMGSRFYWDGGNNKSMFHIHGTAGFGWNSKLSFTDMQLIAQSGVGGTQTGVIGIQLGDVPNAPGTNGVCNPRIADVMIRGVATGVLGYYESDEVSLERLFVKDFTQYGIRNHFGGSGWWIKDAHITDGGPASTGMRLSLVNNCVQGGIIQGAAMLVGIQVDGDGQQGRMVSIQDVYMEVQNPGAAAYGIVLYGVDGGNIRGVSFQGYAGATLIALGDAGSMSCRNIDIGTNRHSQSAGGIAALAVASAGSQNCRITGRQDTNGGVSLITGPWASVERNGRTGLGTPDPQKRLVVSDGGAAGFEFSPNDAGGGFNRMLSYDRAGGAYVRADWEADTHIFRPADGSEKVRVSNSGIGFATAGAASQLVDINDNSLRLRVAKTPASATDAGTTGQWCWDGSYFYICVATNTWHRTAHVTW